MKGLVAKVLIFIGFLLLLSGLILVVQHYNPNRLSFSSPTKFHPHPHLTTTNPPEELVINDLHIRLPIIPAKADNNSWETTGDGVSYLSSSPLPGDTGNSIMYAHNWTSLFGSLPEAKPGQSVEVHYKDGTIKKFVIQYTAVVSPDDSAVLYQSKDKKLTLYTCSGFFDSKRFVVVAEYIGTTLPSFSSSYLQVY